MARHGHAALCALVLVSASAARAESYGAIVRPTRLTVQPGQPLRLRVDGVFVRFDGAKVRAPVWGSAEFVCPAGEEATCREQWARLAPHRCYGVGWDFAPPSVEVGGDPPKPTLWATVRGVREVASSDAVCEQLPAIAKPTLEGPPRIIPASDGPPPVGYHVEERLRPGMIIGGTIATGVGGLLAYLGSYTYSFDKGVLLFTGAAQLVGGIALIAIGSIPRRVYVPNLPGLAPVVHSSGGGVAFTLTF